MANLDRYGFVDPTYDQGTKSVLLAPRIADFNGLRMGLLDNRKHNVDRLLAGFEKAFKKRYEVADVTNVTKFIFSQLASENDIATLVERTDFVISAIAD
jgi:hypothetical protein